MLETPACICSRLCLRSCLPSMQHTSFRCAATFTSHAPSFCQASSCKASSGTAALCTCAGVRWLQPDAGPLTHFQQRPVPLSGSRMARETRQAQDAAVAGSQPPRSPFAGHGQHADDAADMLVTWQASRPDASDAPCAGAVHVLNCKLQVCAWCRMPSACCMPAADAMHGRHAHGRQRKTCQPVVLGGTRDEIRKQVLRKGVPAGGRVLDAVRRSPCG